MRIPEPSLIEAVNQPVITVSATVLLLIAIPAYLTSLQVIFYCNLKTVSSMSNFITLPQAIALTAAYRKQKDLILDAAYKGKDILPDSETFGRAAFEALLAETDAQYIRIYLGMGDDLKIRVIAVAADSKNIDILPAAGAAAGDGASIVEDGIRCPPSCTDGSPLHP